MDINFNDKFMVVALAIGETKMKAGEFSELWTSRKADVVPYKLPVSLIDEVDSEPDIGQQLRRLDDKYRRLAIKQARLLLIVIILILIVFGLLAVLLADRIYGLRPLDLAQAAVNNVLKTQRMSH